MRQIRDILRLKWTLQRSHRETARSVGVSAGSVAAVVGRATHRGLTWEAVTALTDDQLDQTLWGPKLPLTATRSLPDPLHIHTELRGQGVTLELLHLEYLADHPDGLRYSAFCAQYRRWVALQRCSMRQVHKAGEKLFVDYAGQRPHLVDPRTGEVVPVELFVAVLGASNYTYAEATLSQRIPDFLASHTRALDYLGGVTTMVVPDQLRTGVSDPCRYEPGIQRSYADWARHYATAIVPARPTSRSTRFSSAAWTACGSRNRPSPGPPRVATLLSAAPITTKPRTRRARRRADSGHDVPLSSRPEPSPSAVTRC